MKIKNWIVRAIGNRDSPMRLAVATAHARAHDVCYLKDLFLPGLVKVYKHYARHEYFSA